LFLFRNGFGGCGVLLSEAVEAHRWRVSPRLFVVPKLDAHQSTTFLRELDHVAFFRRRNPTADGDFLKALSIEVQHEPVQEDSRVTYPHLDGAIEELRTDDTNPHRILAAVDLRMP